MTYQGPVEPPSVVLALTPDVALAILVREAERAGHPSLLTPATLPTATAAVRMALTVIGVPTDPHPGGDE